MAADSRSAVVSIIIPAYNAEAYIGITIESVLAQTYQHWELIVVDDGSRDNTVTLAQTYADRDSRVRVLPKANGGVAAARNAGFRASSSATKYVLFLDHDDILQSRAVEQMVEVLEAKPSVAAVYGELGIIDSDGTLQPRAALPVELRRHFLRGWRYVDYGANDNLDAAGIIAADCILTPGLMLIRRTAIPAEGLFESRFDAYDDWMAFIVLARQGGIAYVPDTTLLYRLHENNQSKDVSKLRRGKRAIFKSLIHSPDYTTVERRTACVAWVYTEAVDIPSKLRYGLEDLLHLRVVGGGKQFARALTHLGHAATALGYYLLTWVAHPMLTQRTPARKTAS